MQDKFGRTIDYMRISITDRCNLRCRYCMPNGIEWIPMDQILSYEEIELICKQAVKLGIRKFKITGGEPLVRKGCVDFIRRLKQIPEVEQVTMTTNGILLSEYIQGLKESGLDGVNISLDTLDREKYRQITGFDKLTEVLKSLEDAINAGIRVKINVVLQKEVNDREWKDLVLLAKRHPVDVRFIELMPIGHGKESKRISNEWLLTQLKEEYTGIRVDECVHGNGPAVYYNIPEFLGSIGFISAMHGKFCGSCNRIRLTATGELKPCLCFADTVSVREAVRAQDTVALQELLQKAILEKPQMHCFEELSRITEQHKMAQIGG